MRILVVEDNYLIAMELEDILRAASHEVLGPFASSETTLQALSDPAVRIDGALLDVRVGEGDSIAVAEELSRRSCPFAFVTGFSVAGAIPPSLEHVRRIKKPFLEADILDAVERFRSLTQPQHMEIQR